MVKTKPESATKSAEKIKDETTLVLNCVRIKVEKRKKKVVKSPAKIEVKSPEKKEILPLLSEAKLPEKRQITVEKIKALIDCIVSDKMSVSDASKEVNMNLKTATTYYEMYMNDPEHKIPLPRRRQSNSGGLKVTHDQVKALIDCIVNRGMKLGTAATTTKMQYHTAQRYYDKYMSDPDRNIPVPGYEGISPSTQHLSDKIKILIGHIVDDKLSLNAASIKAKLCPKTAKKYYTQYLQDPEHKIPVPATRNYQVSYGSKGPTFEQVVILIRHIVDDNMSVMAAAKEAGMSVETSRRYYNRYLADPNRKIPNPKEKRVFSEKGCTKEQIELMISAIEEDNMSLSAAAIKVGMAINTGSMYYHMYKEDPEHKIPIPLVKGARRDPLAQPTLAQYEQFNNYMVNDHLSTRKAALKAKLVPHRAKMYYDKYMNE